MSEGTSSIWRTGAASTSNEAPRGSRGKANRSKGSGKRNGTKTSQTSRPTNTAAVKKALPNLDPPLHNLEYLKDYYHESISSGKAKQTWIDNPKSQVENYVSVRYARKLVYEDTEGYVDGRRESSIRSQVLVDEEHDVIAYGDAKTKREAEKLAALDALLQLVSKDLIGPQAKRKLKSANNTKAAINGSGTSTPTSASVPKEETIQLSDSTKLTAARAREFMDFYCSHFRFGKPDINLMQISIGKQRSAWDAEMRVGGAKIGIGKGMSKKMATTNVYLDTVAYLVKTDPKLWLTFQTVYRPGSAVIVASPVTFLLSDGLDDELMRLYDNVRATHLFANRPRLAGRIQAGEAADASGRVTPIRSRSQRHHQNHNEDYLERKSMEMSKNLEDYQVDPSMKSIRSQRYSLPVQQMASDVLVKVELNPVSIVMAATGSGKTTQLPQMILDDYIMQGQGSRCNIIVTQPRRIAAISVAQRVAKERGESIGQTIGYAVRFDQRPPKKNGSITFCTTGHFLRRLQAALTEEDQEGYLDDVTHIIIDEIHERDIETDILLIILRRIMAERREKKKTEFKVVLMSATIDATLFCNYFANHNTGLPAPVVDIPGRSFPVQRHYLEETYARLRRLDLPLNAGGWIWEEKSVQKYLDRELTFIGKKETDEFEEEDDFSALIDPLELPYPLIALMISDIIMESHDGHILVFLPGWEEIKTVRGILEDTYNKPIMGIDYTRKDRFEIHVLHSSVPVEDQQAVFEPPRHSGIRRIILATNIAETSITIPDVVYVIDSGKSKETHYDPNRHMQSLVSAWVGTSNVNQRAGRAGRHRKGHAYSLMTRARYDSLNPSSIVAMKRENLSNIVLNIKGMNIAGMDVEELLEEAIEPPAIERVRAAVESLIDLGALDMKKELTSLGQVLTKLPTDASIGKMCLYGAFFRCLDSTLSLAAVLTERSPWIMAEAIREESVTMKTTWSHQQFPSDALATLRALKKFEDLSRRGPHYESSRFCSTNFLHRGAMQTMLQVKNQLFETLRSEGILSTVLSPNGDSSTLRRKRSEIAITMPELNINSTSLPLLTALIAISSTPKFALRTKEKSFRTSQDKTCFMESSSVCHPRASKEQEYTGERHLYSFQTKTSLSTSTSQKMAPPMLRGITLIDPLVFMLFGASKMKPSQDGGMICDGWLPLIGDFGALDNVERLKNLLDICMLRVFEAIDSDNTTNGSQYSKSKRLSEMEVEEFGYLTMTLVKILEGYAEERLENIDKIQKPQYTHTHPQQTPHSVGLL